MRIQSSFDRCQLHLSHDRFPFASLYSHSGIASRLVGLRDWHAHFAYRLHLLFLAARVPAFGPSILVPRTGSDRSLEIVYIHQWYLGYQHLPSLHHQDRRPGIPISNILQFLFGVIISFVVAITIFEIIFLALVGCNLSIYPAFQPAIRAAGYFAVLVDLSLHLSGIGRRYSVTVSFFSLYIFRDPCAG